MSTPAIRQLLKTYPQLANRISVFDDVDAPLPCMRAGAPAQAFIRLRQITAKAVGYDFLGTLGDMARFPDFVSSKPGVAMRSRHKCMDAVDLNQADRNIVVVREIIGSKWYWRVYIKPLKQDGSMGTQMELLRFDFVKRKVLTAPVKGYFVDFTKLAMAEGFERIPAWDSFKFGGPYTTSEWWHFQFDEGKSFEAVMSSLYAQAAQPAKPQGKPVLHLNDRIAEVRELQNALVSLGYLPPGEADGIFGEKTLAAVKRFQKAKGLTGDGIVGANTWKALGK